MEVIKKLDYDPVDTQQQKCVFCLRNCLYKKSNTDVRKVFSVCANYLTGNEFADSFKWNKLRPQERLSPFCKTCYSLGQQLSQINEELEEIQRQLDEHVENFTSKILQLRNNAYHSETESLLSSSEQEEKIQVNETQTEMITEIKEEDPDTPEYVENDSSVSGGFSDLEDERQDDTPCETRPVSDEQQSTDVSANADADKAVPFKKLAGNCFVKLDKLLFTSNGEPIPNGSNIVVIKKKIQSKRPKPAPLRKKQKMLDNDGSQNVDLADVLGSFPVEGGTLDLSQPDLSNPSKPKRKRKKKWKKKNVKPSLKCKLCRVNFASEEKYEAHKQVHETEVPLRCQRCDMTFLDMKEFTEHQWLSQCTLDMLSSSKESFKCDLCSSTFKANYLRLIHRLDHIYPQKVLKYDCNLCESSYGRKWDLMRHFLVHTDEVPFYCDICYKPYRTAEVIATHRLTHNGHLFECSECDVKVKSGYALKVHKRTHITNKKRFQCHLCDKSYELQGFLNKHLNHHNRPHVCEFCGRSFPEIYFLRKHRLTHTETDMKKIKPYYCGHGNCAYKFSNNTERQYHIKLFHSADKFYCSRCGKAFNSMTILQHHQKRGTGCRDFPCTECTMVFKTFRELTLHSYTHTGQDLQCPHCKKIFTQKGFYLRHLNWHASGQEYRCKECQKIFQTREGLLAHAVSHTGEKPFKCDDCNVAFARKVSYTKHLKKH